MKSKRGGIAAELNAGMIVKILLSYFNYYRFLTRVEWRDNYAHYGVSLCV